MDKLRLSGHTIRRSAEVLEREINAILAADITDPVQRRATVDKVRALRGQLNVWLAIADGKLPATAKTNSKTEKEN